MTRYCHRCHAKTEHEDAGHAKRYGYRRVRCVNCRYVRYVQEGTR